MRRAPGRARASPEIGNDVSTPTVSTPAVSTPARCTPCTRSDDLVVLADARTPVEHEVLEQFLRKTHPDTRLLHLDDPAVAGLPDSCVVAPARVVWLPSAAPDAGQGRAPAWADLVELRTPHQPRIGAQRRIARRSPDRVHVVAGEPATVYNLRRRFHDAAETGTFVSYVRRQAVLACERAELAVIGDRYKVPQLVVEQVTSSAEFQRKVRGLASELDRPKADVLEEAKNRTVEPGDCAEQAHARPLRPGQSRLLRARVEHRCHANNSTACAS